jgi:hypothetical protein
MKNTEYRNTGRKRRKSCVKDAEKKLEVGLKTSTRFIDLTASFRGLFCVFCAAFATFASGIQIL